MNEFALRAFDFQNDLIKCTDVEFKLSSSRLELFVFFNIIIFFSFTQQTLPSLPLLPPWMSCSSNRAGELAVTF